MSDDASTNQDAFKPASRLEALRQRFKSGAPLLSAGTMTSRILGLLRDMAMAAYFDRTVTDAWAAAFRLPNFFRRLLGEGSLSLSFIPVFVEIGGPTRNARGRNLVNAFYTFLLVFLAVLTIWGFLLIEPLLKILLDSSYLYDREKYVLTVKMARLMFGFVFFIASYAYFMAILQALGEFRWPAFAPLFFNIAMIGFTLMPNSWFTFPGEGLAWGVLIGGILQASVLVPILANKRYFPTVQWTGMTDDLKRLLKRVFPAICGLGVLQLMTLINLHFASALGTGVISALYWGDRLLELPLSLVAVSLSAAILPLLSEHWSREEKSKLRDLQSEQLLTSGVWMVPSAFGLYFLAAPIVEVLFHRGQFGARDLEQTSLIVKIYALSLISLSGSRLLLNAMAAAHEMTKAASVSILALVVHVVLAPSLMSRYGLAGLMYSTLAANTLQFLLLALLFHWKIGTLGWMRLIGKYLVLAVFSLGIAASPFVYQYTLAHGLPAWMSLGIGLLIGGGVYLLLGRLTRFHEIFLTFG